MQRDLRLSSVLVAVLVAACSSDPEKTAPPPTVDADRSTLEAAPGTAIADGASPVTLTATARSASGAAIAGRVAAFAVTGTGHALGAAEATTDAAGVATVTLTSTRAEAKTVSVRIDGVALRQTATATFGPGPAAALSLAGVPSTATAGRPTAITVTATDAHGNVATGYHGTLRATSSDPAAQLPGDLVFSEADAGRRTFPVAWRTGGAATLILTDSLDASLGVTGSTSVAPAEPFRLAFASQPADAIAGTLFTPSVRVSVLDAFGNLVTDGIPSVTLQLQGGTPGALLAGGEALPAAAGVAEFVALSTGTAGTGYRLVAASPGLLAASSDAFDVGAAEPDAATSSAVAEPSTLPAGASAALVATVRDSFGNPIPGVTITLVASGAGNAITQPGSVTDAAGVAVGALSSAVAESKTVTVQAAGLPLSTRPVVTFTAGFADAARSSAAASPTAIVADGVATSTVTVTLRDAHDNPIAGQPVTLSSSRGLADLLSGWWEATDSQGRAVFAIRSELAGTSTLTAAVQTGASATSLSTQVEFLAGPVSATRSTVVATPATVGADGASPATVTVTLLDAQGNPVSGKEVSLTSDRGADDVITPATATSGASGTAIFTAVSERFGTATFTATDTTDGLALAQAAPVAFLGTVSPSRSTVVAASPTVLANGSASTAITVRIADAFGNPVQGVEVALASDRGPIDAVSPPSATTDAVGQVTFTVASPRFGPATFTAIASDYGVTVLPTASVGFLAYLQFATQPSEAVEAGTSFEPPVAVAARDAEGNTDAASSSDVVMALGTTTSGAALHGTLTASPSEGVATFGDLYLDKAWSGYTLVASTAAPGIPPVTSTPFTVAPGSPAALAFAVQPSSTGAGPSAPIQIALLDPFGNTTTATGPAVTLALGSDPGGATLSGSLSEESFQGIATFEGLEISPPGTGYTLVASDPLGLLAPATSRPFDVLAPASIGDGTPGSCTEATLDAALAAGGHHHFHCGPDPVTITLSGTKSIAVDVGLDGGGLVTLSGAGARQLFTIPAGRRLDLERLTLTAGATGGNGGAIYNAGTLSLAACTLSGSIAASSNAWGGGTSANGGAVHNDGGTLLVSASTFASNSTGGNWNSYGTFHNGGAIFITGGAVAISGSTFTGNSASGYGPYGGTSCNGGAIHQSGGSLRVIGSVFSGNGAGGTYQDEGVMSNGGAIFSAGGTLLIAGSTFDGNTTGSYAPYGGTIANGGALHVGGGGVTVLGSTFGGNGVGSSWPYGCTAANGGAIFVAAGSLLAVNSTFFGNTASAYGPYNATVANGGAVFNGGGTVRLVNATVASNAVGVTWCDSSTCTLGSGLYGGATLVNTLVAGSGSCSGSFVDGGHNLDSSGSCGVGPATDPLLAAAGLADHGGPTRTVALQDGSPAIDAGDAAVCAAPPVLGVDQRGYRRPGAGASTCSIGAFEYASAGSP